VEPDTRDFAFWDATPGMILNREIFDMWLRRSARDAGILAMPRGLSLRVSLTPLANAGRSAGQGSDGYPYRADINGDSETDSVLYYQTIEYGSTHHRSGRLAPHRR
jgi:hypothetical protein